MLFVLVMYQINRSRHNRQISRGRGTNWLRFGATELLAMRWRWTCSTSVEELEVEEWVDSFPTAEARRHPGEAHARAAVAGGRVGCACLRRRLGLGVSEWVSEWVSSWVKSRYDRRYLDKCAGSCLNSPPGEASVLAGGLIARQERYQCWRSDYATRQHKWTQYWRST
jgi:hypothetical protein